MKKKSMFCYRLQVLLRLWCLISFSCVVGNGCATTHTTAPISKSGFYLDTVVTITLYDTSDENLLDKGLALCKDYDKLLSITNKESDIYKINHSNGKAVEVSEETVYLIKKGMEYGKISDGKFDISIGSVSRLWDFTSENPQLPPSQTIEKQLQYVNYSQIQLEECRVTVPEGMKLDLGGIAKGYIGDKLVEFYKQQGVTSALLNLGGNILCIGTPPNKDAFRIGIKKPFSENDSITSIAMQDGCVVTSGIYERCFEKDGKLYHHIIDPSTGYPVKTDLYSVTIIGETSMDADALSTICLAFGKEKGKEFIEKQTDVRAIFVTDQNDVLNINTVK